MKQAFFIFAGIVVLSSTVTAGGQYVVVTASFANVYENLEPKSKILVQAKKGDQLELVYPGTSWYQVKVGGTVGWLERQAGDVVSNPSRIPLATLAVFVIVLAGTLGGVYYFIRRQRAAA
jgi:hypothetical protein